MTIEIAFPLFPITNLLSDKKAIAVFIIAAQIAEQRLSTEVACMSR